jgi:hypothetical protein
MFQRFIFTALIMTALIAACFNVGKLNAGTYEGPFVVRIMDAQNKKPVSGAIISFSGDKGEKISGVSNEMGWVQISDFPFTEEDDKEGKIYFTVSADGYSQLKDRSPVYQKRLMMSKKNLAPESFRIVLSWGKYPKDLDGHLFFDQGHVYWNAPKDHWSASLDVDHRESFGPETITISEIIEGAHYTYVVHDYTNRYEQGTALSGSDARVHVYQGEESELIETFYITPNQPGNIWYVFGMGPERKIKAVNKVDQVDYNSWYYSGN